MDEGDLLVGQPLAESRHPQRFTGPLGGQITAPEAIEALLGPKSSSGTTAGWLGFLERKENVIFLGPPGVGKTHLAISLAIAAAQSGRRSTTVP